MPPTAPCRLLAFRSLSNPLPSHRAGPQTRFLPGESSFLRLEALNGRCRKDLGGQELRVPRGRERGSREAPPPPRGAEARGSPCEASLLPRGPGAWSWGGGQGGHRIGAPALAAALTSCGRPRATQGPSVLSAARVWQGLHPGARFRQEPFEGRMNRAQCLPPAEGGRGPRQLPEGLLSGAEEAHLQAWSGFSPRRTRRPGPGCPRPLPEGAPCSTVVLNERL